jgi:hypothetical protein
MAEYKQPFQEFLEQVMDAEPQRTRGCALHNMLMYSRRDLGDQIAGTDLDPWNDDKRIEACLNWLEEHWEDPK